MKKIAFIICILCLVMALLPTMFACKDKPQEETPVVEEAAYTVDKDDNTMYYIGSYPQKRVDIAVADVKTGVQDPVTKWYTYQDKEYAIIKANPFEEEYAFSDGTKVVKDTEYVFEVEKIKWKAIYSPKGERLLFADKILDVSRFAGLENCTIEHGDYIIEQEVYANYYRYSDLRNALNNFYEYAFSLKEKQAIITKIQDNITSSKDKTLYSERQDNTEDPCFVLAYSDFMKDAYKINFAVDESTYKTNRIKTVTDYALAKGAICVTENRVGCYWLRSTGTTSNGIAGINTVGAYEPNISITIDYRGICPSIYLAV